MAGKYGYMRKFNLSLKRRIKAINVLALDGDCNLIFRQSLLSRLKALVYVY